MGTRVELGPAPRFIDAEGVPHFTLESYANATIADPLLPEESKLRRIVVSAREQGFDLPTVRAVLPSRYHAEFAALTEEQLAATSAEIDENTREVAEIAGPIRVRVVRLPLGPRTQAPTARSARSSVRRFPHRHGGRAPRRRRIRTRSGSRGDPPREPGDDPEPPDLARFAGRFGAVRALLDAYVRPSGVWAEIARHERERGQ